MIAHQRRKNAERQPAEQEFPCRIRAEAAQIRAGIQESAHIQRRHHTDIQQKVRPPGLVVARPDAAVAVHADIGGT